jgi:hypothetical protein
VGGSISIEGYHQAKITTMKVEAYSWHIQVEGVSLRAQPLSSVTDI